MPPIPSSVGLAGDGETVLFVAHPGHELRVHHWLEKVRPTVLVLTDGSGPSGLSRLESTTRLLAAAGGRPGPVYGRFSDRELYEAVRQRRSELFCLLVDELVTLLRQMDAREVAGDAVEGFNPAHDLCRLLLNAAVAILRAGSLPGLRNRDFTLEALPAHCPADMHGEATWIHLDEAALGRKLEAAGTFKGMEAEVSAILRAHGPAPFAVECLRPVRYGLGIGAQVGEVPFYELHGQKRVEQGIYTETLRFREHIEPLARDLMRHVEARTGSRAACR